MTDRTSADLLQLQIESLPGEALILRMVGEIDLSSAHLVTEELASMAAKKPKSIVLDATRVTFMDSTGLHALVEGKRILHDTGARILLVPSTQVRRVLELVFPEPLFADRLNTMEEALAALEQPSND